MQYIIEETKLSELPDKPINIKNCLIKYNLDGYWQKHHGQIILTIARHLRNIKKIEEMSLIIVEEGDSRRLFCFITWSDRCFTVRLKSRCFLFNIKISKDLEIKGSSKKIKQNKDVIVKKNKADIAKTSDNPNYFPHKQRFGLLLPYEINTFLKTEMYTEIIKYLGQGGVLTFQGGPDDDFFNEQENTSETILESENLDEANFEKEEGPNT